MSFDLCSYFLSVVYRLRERDQESNEKGAGKSAVNQMKNLDTREPKISAMYFKTEYA